MADIQVEAAAFTTLYSTNTLWGPFWLSKTVGAIVGITGSGQDLAVWRTTDGGANWSSAIALKAHTCQHASVSMDRSGSPLLHVAYLDSAGDVIGYAPFNLSTGAWGTEVETSHDVNTTSASNKCFISLSPSGTILMGAVNSGTASIAVLSTDGGGSFSAVSDPFESTAHDLVIGAYMNAADPDDHAILFWDASANQITIKTYDKSADTWAENAGGAITAAENLTYENWDVTYRESDGATLLAVWNELDSATADLITAYVVCNALTGLSFTTTTEVLTNPGSEYVRTAIFCDQETDDIYVGWLAGSAWGSTTGAYYDVSTDGMSTWSGSPVQLSEDADDDLRQIAFGAHIASQGGRFQPCWFNDDLNDILATNAAAFDIEAVSSGTDATITGVAATATAAGLTGAVAAIRIVAVTGEAATATAAGLLGTAAAVRIVAISGEAATATAAGLEGAVAITIDATITGEAAAGTAAGLEGTVAAIRIVAVAGEAAAATADALEGSVSTGANASIAGEAAAATAAGLIGSVAAIRIVAVTGTAATATAAANEGAVAALRVVTISGEAATATGAGLTGTVSAIGIVAVTGTAATATSEALVGAVAVGGILVPVYIVGVARDAPIASVVARDAPLALGTARHAPIASGVAWDNGIATGDARDHPVLVGSASDG